MVEEMKRIMRLPKDGPLEEDEEKSQELREGLVKWAEEMEKRGPELRWYIEHTIEERMAHLRVAYMMQREGGIVDGWVWLDEEERKFIALYILCTGNLLRVAEEMGKGLKQVYEFLSPERGLWIMRAIDYYAARMEVLKKNLIGVTTLKYLVDTAPDLIKKDQPPETRRKTGRDLMEAEGWFPKVPAAPQQTNVQVNVEIPEWKK